MKKIIVLIQKCLGNIFQRKSRKMMIGDFMDMIAHNPSIKNEYVKGEEDNISKWKVLSSKVSPIAYRLYSPFIGGSPNIMPPDVARAFVEPILNPGENIPFYNDKNSLNLIVPQEDTPKVYIRAIGNNLMDGAYNPISRDSFDALFENVEKIIVKPAKEQGGSGITFFEKRNDGYFVNNQGAVLTLDWLKNNYHTDYLVQECFKQSEYISQFNPTSVNTIRAITYRDVNTGEIHYRGAVLRMGGKGAVIDNATTGGCFVGIDDNGVLKDKVFDKYGRCVNIFNDIDFSKTHFQIPNYDEIKKFAKKVSSRIPHMNLFALDIVLDVNNNPKLIEVNTQSFTAYFMQLTNEPVFGEYTDDVITYCKNNKNRLAVRIRYMLK